MDHNPDHKPRRADPRKRAIGATFLIRVPLPTKFGAEYDLSNRPTSTPMLLKPGEERPLTKPRKASHSQPPGGCTWEPTFVRVNASTGRKLSENEDSGGPFFTGSQAWGTMAAKLEIEDGSGEWVRNDAVYMPIDYLEVLDIEVLTD